MLWCAKNLRFAPQVWIPALVVTAALAAPALQAATPGPLLMPVSELPPQRTVLVFGQRIAYYDLGSGPTIVLVHGFASQARFDWGNVMLPLSRHHRVIALDEIGWGQSDKPSINYSIQTFVEFLGEFLRVMKVDHFTLAGESLGGWITADYTIQALGSPTTGENTLPRPDKLILSDAAGYQPLPKSVAAIAPGTLEDAGEVAVVFYDKARVTPEFIRQAWIMRMKANDGSTQRLLLGNPSLEQETVGGKLDAITIPTLVVWGAEDELVPLANGHGYAAKIPHAKLVVIAKSGHCPACEQPDAFLAAVNAFLD